MTLIQRFEHYIKLATHRKKYKPEDRETMVLLEEQLRVALDPEVLLEHRTGPDCEDHVEWVHDDLKAMWFEGDDYVLFTLKPEGRVFQQLAIPRDMLLMITETINDYYVELYSKKPV